MKRGCWLFWAIFLVIRWTYANMFWLFSTANFCWYHLHPYFLKYDFFFLFSCSRRNRHCFSTCPVAICDFLLMKLCTPEGTEEPLSLSLWEKDKWWYCIIICVCPRVCVYNVCMWVYACVSLPPKSLFFIILLLFITHSLFCLYCGLQSCLLVPTTDTVALLLIVDSRIMG